MSWSVQGRRRERHIGISSSIVGGDRGRCVWHGGRIHHDPPMACEDFEMIAEASVSPPGGHVMNELCTQVNVG